MLLDHVISVFNPYLALTYIIWSSDFALYLWPYLIDKHHTWILVQFHVSDLIVFVGHCDLYFMVLWFLPCISHWIKLEGITLLIFVQSDTVNDILFSSPARSPGRAIVLPPALASASSLASGFYIKVFYVMGKALSGELSCPCDRSCCRSLWHISWSSDFALYLWSYRTTSYLKYLFSLALWITSFCRLLWPIFHGPT